MVRPKKEEEPRGPWTCPTCDHHHDEKPLMEPDDYEYRGRVGEDVTKTYKDPDRGALWMQVRMLYEQNRNADAVIEIRERGSNNEWEVRRILSWEEHFTRPMRLRSDPDRSSVDGG